ncbi:MAG: hypothetical protein HOC95_02545 [Candidatus Diapherotrites archaeon]|nr:hypothetical protein [Candidatus Diapherotrites archaeon]
MVSEQIISDTIKRMLSAGVEKDTIISTLKDIGLSEAEAAELVNKQEASTTTSQGADQSTASPDLKSSFDQLKTMKNELETQSTVKELHDTTTHNMLNEHSQKIEDVGKKLDEVKTELQKKPAPQVTQKVDNTSLEGRLTEIEAKVDATMKLMKDILDVNRKTLTAIESKK